RACRSAARPGLRHRLCPDRTQQAGRRANRRRPDREARALRRRAGRDPRVREAEDPEDRPDPGEVMARGLTTRSRFMVAYLVLGAAVGTGIGVFIVLLERPGPTPPPAWSSWKPPASSTVLRTKQIATHVGSGYRLPSGHPLNRIVIGAP